MPMLSSGDELDVQLTGGQEAIANPILFPETMPAPVSVENRDVVYADREDDREPGISF